MCVRNCFGRCSQIHSDDEYGTDFSLEQLEGLVHTPTVPLFVAMVLLFPETLEQLRLCQLEMEQVRMMTTGCKSTLSRKARGRAKANTKTRKDISRTTQATRAIQTSTCARTVAELDIGRKTAGDHVEELTTIPPVTTAAHRKARTTRKAKAKADKSNHSSETASTVSYPSQDPSVVGELSCIPSVETESLDHRCDNQFRVIHKETSWCRVFAS